MSLNWNRIYQITWSVYNLPFVAAACLWRRCMRKTTFIAIVGSMGKSTATKCLYKILSSQFSCITNEDSNGRLGLTRTVLKVRPRHRFAVLEVGILKKNRMWRSAFMVKPHVVSMTGVARRHVSGLGTLDSILYEKAQIMRHLRTDGLVTLNGDDQRVASLAGSIPCPVRIFGSDPKHDVWADEVSAVWPERLRLRVHVGRESYPLQTALVGTHWTPSVLAAIATSVSLGVTPRDAADALHGIEPFPVRLDPVTIPSGAVILRDEYNGGLPTYRVALEILREARVKRRIAAVGRVTEAEGRPTEGARQLGKLLAVSADLAVVTGPQAAEIRAAAVNAGMSFDTILIVEDVRAMSDWIGSQSRSGDLILLKGEWNEHLSRASFAQLGSVDCWQFPCPVPVVCDKCSKLGFVPRGEVA